MDEIEIFSVWIFNLFLCDVLFDALEYLFGVCGGKGFESNGKTAVDVSTAVAVGVPRHAVLARGGAVRFRILQRHAYLNRSRLCYHDFVQAPFLVCVLSDGDNDTAHLQSEKCDSETERGIKTGILKKNKKGNLKQWQF